MNRKQAGHTRQPASVVGEAAPPAPEPCERLIALEDAPRGQAETDPRKSRGVESRHSGGLSAVEAVGAPEVSENTVPPDGNMAKAWPRREAGGGDER